MRVKASDSHTWTSVQLADELIGEKAGRFQRGSKRIIGGYGDLQIFVRLKVRENHVVKITFASVPL